MSATPSDAPRQLDVSEVGDWVARWEREGFSPVLLDVREPWETALARLDVPGTRAVDLPMMSVPQRLDALPADQPILALCHHGMRSLQVVAFLLRQGYPYTYNIAGGIDASSASVDPTVPRY